MFMYIMWMSNIEGLREVLQARAKRTEIKGEKIRQISAFWNFSLT